MAKLGLVKAKGERFEDKVHGDADSESLARERDSRMRGPGA